jgi:hypothetical protein
MYNPKILGYTLLQLKKLKIKKSQNIGENMPNRVTLPKRPPVFPRKSRSCQTHWGHRKCFVMRKLVQDIFSLLSRVTRLGEFRLFGDCLLWAVLLKMTKVAKILGYFLYGKIDINALGYIHFGWLFHELIWSPCSYPQNMIMYSVLRFLYLTCFCQPMYALKANGI